MFKKVISIIAGCISLLIIPSWFIYSYPIKAILNFGLFGEYDHRINSTKDIYAPKFENMGFSYEIAMFINYFLTYIYVIPVFILSIFYIFKIINFVIHWYNDLLHQRKTVRKFKKTIFDQLIFILSLIFLIFFISAYFI